jgi:cell division septal protein FtsQ
MTFRRGIRRAGGHPRRSSRVRRASAGLSRVRAGAALGMLLSTAAMYGAAASPAFGLGPVIVHGAQFTDAAAISARLGVVPGTNLFALSTEPLTARVRELPTVAAADVTIKLPDTLDVAIHERDPILVWAIGERRFLVDRDGVLFAELSATGRPDAASLPALTDARAASATFAVGGRLDPLDLDAATRLGSIKPADVGSAAQHLAVSITDENGFVVSATPGGWSAVFGFYTPSLRRPDLIAGQVRLLHTLLDGREPAVDRVILASDTSGTYIPRPSATPRR